MGWFPVFTLLLGFFIKFISDAIEHRRSLERDREARRETRRDQLSEQRRIFQGETLLALQEAVMDLMRAVGAAHHHDEMAYKQTGQWHKQLLGEELSQANFLSLRRTGMLRVRVRDASLRQLVENFRDHAVKMEFVSKEESRPTLTSMGAISDQIQERVGELLRTLDDEENILK